MYRNYLQFQGSQHLQMQAYLSILRSPIRLPTRLLSAVSRGPASVHGKATKEDFCLFPPSLLAGFGMVPGTRSKCQWLSAPLCGFVHILQRANSLVMRVPVNHESEDPQTVWTAANILLSSFLLSFIHS